MNLLFYSISYLYFTPTTITYCWYFITPSTVSSLNRYFPVLRKRETSQLKAFDPSYLCVYPDLPSDSPIKVAREFSSQSCPFSLNNTSGRNAVYSLSNFPGILGAGFSTIDRTVQHALGAIRKYVDYLWSETLLLAGESRTSIRAIQFLVLRTPTIIFMFICARFY